MHTPMTDQGDAGSPTARPTPTNAAPAADTELVRLRHRVDQLDDQIAALLQERARISQAIGRAKQEEPAGSIYVPEREAEVLARVSEAAGPLNPAALRRVYLEVLSASRALQRPLRIAHLGPAATFGYQAAREHFGGSAEYEPCATNPDVVTAVEKGVADFGLVPFENSTEGPVNEVLDRLVDTPLRVCAEITIPVAHALMSQARSLPEVRRVLSHPQAAAQVRDWLSSHLPGVPVEATTSTGRAAELAAADARSAAVGPRIAADVYALNVLADNIQDLADNVTRFLVLGRTASGRPTGRDRTALVFSIVDHVGALRDLTDAFASNGVNLSSIQSRPSRRRAWDYVFFVELDGHQSEDRVARALEAARAYTVFLTVLGSWPVPPPPAATAAA